MAFLIATGTSSPGLTIGGTNISDHVRSIEVQQNVADLDVTAMGAVSQQHAPGLRDDRMIVTFFQDFAATKVDALINALVGSSGGATVVAYASGTTATSTAPSYTCVMSPFTYSPLNGDVGTAFQTQVTFLPVQGSAGIVRATA